MPALRVAYDATPLLGVRTGVGHVTAGLLDHLAGRDDVEMRAYAVTWKGRERLRSAVPPTVRACTAPIPARLTRLLWPRVPRPRIEAWTGPVDVVHATNFVAPPARAPVVVTVHDLTPVRFPELCTPDARTYPRLIRRAIARGAVVHVFSDFVGAEVVDAFGLDPARVVRVHPGLVAPAGGDGARGRTLAGADRYVLALGTVEPRKNLPGLVRAFDRLAADDPDVVLVVAGPDGWGTARLDDAIAAAGHADRVRRLGYVTGAERAALLAGASVLAYPSIYEGFGHPPLEAMQAGVPVVAAAAGALPEVLGDAALLPRAADDDALADALDTALHDETRRRDLVARGHARVARYGWDASVAGFLALYRTVAQGP